MDGGRQRADRRAARLRNLAFVLLVAALLFLAGEGFASAHAVLKGTDPVDGSVLKTAPKAITLTFTESVGLLDNSIRVLEPDNRRVHTGEQRHADGRPDTARVTLPDLKQGTYIVAWRVVSADSHPVSGALAFSVGKRTAATVALPSTGPQDDASTALYNIARYVVYGGLAVLLGATAFAMVTGVAAPRGVLVGGWWALLVTTLALLLLRGPYERGSGLAAALDPSVLRETATSRPGLALLARAVLLAVAALTAWRAGPVPRRRGEDDRIPEGSGSGVGRARLALVTVLSLALALTWAVAGHAAAGSQVPLAMTSTVLHLLAMAVWLGGLAALLTVVYRTPEKLPAPAVARFSRLSLASVAVLVVTGAYQSWRELGSLDALTSTPYGRLLTVKLVAVVLLLAAAACSRRFTARLALPERQAETTVPERVRETVGACEKDGDAVTVRTDPAVGAGAKDARRAAASTPTEAEPDGIHRVGRAAPVGLVDPAPPRQALRRSVLAEVTIGVVVLMLTTLLTATQPGRAAEEAAVAADQPLGSITTLPFDAGTPGGRGKLQIELTPGRAGENAVQVVVFGPDGGISTVPEVRLTFTLEDRGVGPLHAKLTDRGGYWSADTLNLPLPGVWTMKAAVRTTSIDQVTVSKRLRIA